LAFDLVGYSTCCSWVGADAVRTSARHARRRRV
jgi:hypothetical protein